MTVKPMLAIPLKKANIQTWSDWVAQEKFDGHRVIVRVAAGATRSDRDVRAWSRPRKRAGGTEKTMEDRPLPESLRVAIGSFLPIGLYDGELLTPTIDGRAGTSSDVTRLDGRHRLCFYVFDVLELRGRSVLSESMEMRYGLLKQLNLASTDAPGDSQVALASVFPLTRERDVTALTQRVWKRGGEGLILKRRSAIYHPGKRSPDWVKIKKRLTAALSVVGFEESRGEIQNRGQFAIVKLADDQGRQTTCKTVDDDQLAAFEREWAAVLKRKPKADPQVDHPAIGRLLRIEFQDYTPDGHFRGPVIWDRWEDE